ncbi:hypothetical protein [Acinetobacter baumannii]|uniref:hypothetical protein n=1 Tax=Acinetobacter baumannii TaxID=470 RepID=UPI0022B3609D|nr:hypothetical protein [Acinetobacter baumannii]
MSEFKVGDCVVAYPERYKPQTMQITEIKDGDWLATLDGHYLIPICDLRHAKPSEAAAGHRIDCCEILERPENHISPLCEVKNHE